MTDRVAGHLFADSPRGESCACGMTWIDVLNERERWKKGELGIAHNDGGEIGLTEGEIKTLHAKLQRIWDAGMRF